MGDLFFEQRGIVLQRGGAAAVITCGAVRVTRHYIRKMSREAYYRGKEK